jgi:cytidylate kinase
MWKESNPEKWMPADDDHFIPTNKERVETFTRPTITISRPTGVGGYAVASALSDYMQARAPCPGGWKVWSRNIIHKVMEDHKLHGKVGEFIKESHKGMIRDSVEEWLGLHPSAWTLVQQTNETMLDLAKKGDVILMGWGSFLVTRELETVFHVRLVASLEKRLQKVLPGHNLDEKAALRYIKKEDEGRRRYIKDNFGKDVGDPLLYHLVINLDLYGYDDAARLIGDEVVRRFGLAGGTKKAGSGSNLRL